MRLMSVFALIFVMLVQMVQVQAVEKDNTDLDENIVILASETDFRCGSNGRVTVGDDGSVSVIGANEGAFLECEADFKTAGVYHIIAECTKSSNSGIVQFAVDNDKINEGIDLYSGSTATEEKDFGFASISEGRHRIRFSSFIKNEKSTGYKIQINKITFKKETVSVAIESDNIGNIFIEGEELPKFKVTMTNNSNKRVEYEIDYEATSSHGHEKNIITEESFEPFETKVKTVEIPVDFKDTYKLEVVLKCKELGENYSVGTEFSYIERVEELDEYAKDSIFGVCTHFAQKKGDTFINAELLSKAGVKWIRDDIAWGGMEPQKGVYNISDHNKQWINEVFSKNINILACFTYGNVNYDGDVAPYTESGLEGYANAAAFLAKEYKDKISAMEIWNEYSTGMGNPHGRGPEVYTEMMKRSYIKIKEVNPEMQVVGGGALHPSPQWFKRVFDEGGFDYCDAISYHPYCIPDAPLGIPNYLYRSRELMWRYGDEKPQWLTEVGWYIGNARTAVSESVHASYMMMTYILGMVNGAGRIFYYDFQDDFSDLDESEGNYGFIKCFENVDVPYAAKQAYVAFAAMVNKLEGAKYQTRYQFNSNVSAYVFEDRNGNEVVVLFNPSGGAEKTELRGKSLEMQAYDMFGNPCTVDKISVEPIYLVGKKGQFNPAEMEISKFPKLSAAVSVYPEGDFDGVGLGFSGISIEHSQPYVYKDGRPTWSAGSSNKEKKLSFKIDDSYAYGKIMPANFTVEYYDEGNGSFYITYPTANGNKDTGKISLTNTLTWKTADIYIPDGKYANNCDNADFLIIPSDDIYITKVSIKKISGIENTEIKAVISDVVELTNTTIRLGDSNNFSIVERNGRKAVKTNNKTEALYIYVNINDDIVYDGSYDLKVYVDYFDEGNGHFSISYAKRDGEQWDVSDDVKLTDTGEWKTACIEVPAAKCDNSNGGDFRVALWDGVHGLSPEDVIIGGIKIELPQEEKKEYIPLDDISGHWAEDVVTKMHQNEIIAGYEDNSFKPDSPIKIDEFISMLISYLKIEVEPTGGYWAENIIKEAIELGIVKDGEINDYTKNINRAQMALMMSRVSGGDTFKNSESYIDNIGDYFDIDPIYQTAVLGCNAMGIMYGYEDGKFHIEREATRAEAVAMIERL